MIAKFIMPGRQGGGFILTTILGIAGAFLGGFVANDLLKLGTSSGNPLNVMSIVVAVVGALLVLLIYGLIFGRKRK